MKHLLAIIIVGAGLAAGGPAGADEIHLVGTPIALKRCSVEGFSGGGVDYRDARGRRTNRPLEDVRAIGFDGLDVLDEAEAALREGDMELGERLLLRALLEAPSNVARTWCHARLARVHDRQGEYLACVRHAAEVWRMSPDPSWKSLRPLRAPDPDGHAESYAVAVEAVDALNRARRSLEQRTLHDLADALLETVRPMHARLRAAHDGPRPDPTLTMSGVAIEAILADELPEGIPASEPVAGSIDDAAENADRGTATKSSARPTVFAPGEPTRGTGSATQIQRLLESGRFDEALAACRAAAQDPGDRPLDRLLYQYGAALLGAGDHRRAAVKFTEVAVLYPRSAFAVAGLIETAVIHARHLGRPATARRLLETALERASSLESDALVQRATQEIEALPGSAR